MKSSKNNLEPLEFSKCPETAVGVSSFYLMDWESAMQIFDLDNETMTAHSVEFTGKGKKPSFVKWDLKPEEKNTQQQQVVEHQMSMVFTGDKTDQIKNALMEMDGNGAAILTMANGDKHVYKLKFNKPKKETMIEKILKFISKINWWFIGALFATDLLFFILAGPTDENPEPNAIFGAGLVIIVFLAMVKFFFKPKPDQ